MKLLVEHGADPSSLTKPGRRRCTPRPALALRGTGVARALFGREAVKYCVELGNDVNVADNRGYTALHGAAFSATMT